MENVVPQFIDAFKDQLQFTANISTAGIGAVLYTWRQTIGILGDREMRGYRYVGLLLVPLALFVLAVVIGYIAAAAISGYYYEFIVDYDTSKGVALTAADAKTHFGSQYVQFLQICAVVQMLCSVIGIVLVAVWYFFNVIRRFDGPRLGGGK